MQEWLKNIKSPLLQAIGILGLIVSLWSNSYEFWWAILASLIFLILVILYNKPSSREAAYLYLNKKIDISKVEELTKIKYKIGLIGIQSVGKSTFLENISLLKHEDKETALPYAIIIQLNVEGKNENIAFLDSVGKSYVNQFNIAKLCDKLIIFVDYGLDKNIDTERFNEHKKFFEQLKNAIIESNHTPNKVIFVINKYDLWSKSGYDNKELIDYYEHIFKIFQIGNMFKKQQIVYNHSNFDHNKVIHLRNLACLETQDNRI